MFATSADRVPSQSSDAVNARIARDIEASVVYHATRPDEIDRRLAELDEEWDVERMLQANAASLMLAGLALGAAVDRRWLALPAGVAAFLLQHALQGWCPPLPVLRRLGFRTVREIDREREALAALRGEGAAKADAGAAGEAARRMARHH